LLFNQSYYSCVCVGVWVCGCVCVCVGVCGCGGGCVCACACVCVYSHVCLTTSCTVGHIRNNTTQQNNNYIWLYKQQMVCSCVYVRCIKRWDTLFAEHRSVEMNQNLRSEDECLSTYLTRLLPQVKSSVLCVDIKNDVILWGHILFS
jgi:hypothetical protein